MQSRASHPIDVGDSLATYTRPALIVPELRQRDTAGVIKELSEVLAAAGCVPDLLAFYHAAINHEFLVNSATESGIAFPHARLNGVTQSSFAFGRAPAPVVWGPRPSQPVRFVFLLAVPATDAAGFLQLLSALARFAQNGNGLRSLDAEPTQEQIYELFSRVKLRQG